MYKLLLALHLLFAVFAIGPLVGIATTAGRGLRHGDGAATAAAARGLRVYSAASVLVVVAGFALMSVDSPFHAGQQVAEFSDVWVWLSLLLWLAVVALAWFVIVPALQRSGVLNDAGRGARTELGKVAASGGVIGVLVAVIVVLMVYRPGS